MVVALDVMYKAAGVLALPISAVAILFAGRADWRGKSQHKSLENEIRLVRAELENLSEAREARVEQLKRVVETVANICGEFPDVEDVALNDILSFDTNKLERLSSIADVFVSREIRAVPGLQAELNELLRTVDDILSDIKELSVASGSQSPEDIASVADLINNAYVLASRCDGSLQQGQKGDASSDMDAGKD